MDFKTIILAVIIAFTVLGIISALTKTFSRTTGRSLLRLIFIAASAIIAYFVAAGFLTKYADTCITFATGLGLDSSIAEAIGKYISAEGTVGFELTNLILKLAAPVLYFAVFFAVNLVLWIIYLIFAAIFTKKLTKEAKITRSAGDKLVALVINVAIQLIIVTSLLFPINGYIAITSDVMTDESSITEVLGEGEAADTFVDVYSAAKNNKLNEILYYKISKKVTDKLTLVAVNDEEGNKIVATVGECISTIMKIVPEIEQVTKVDEGQETALPINTDAVLKVANILKENKYLDRLFGLTFNEFSGEGELNDLLGAIFTSSDSETTWNYNLSALDNLLAMNDMEVNEKIVDSIKNSLKATNYSSTALKAVANIVNLAEAISTPVEEISSLSVESVAENLDADSAQFVKNALSAEVITALVGDENKDMAEVVSDAIACVVDGLLELEEENYESESKAIGEIFTIYSDSAKVEELKQDEIAERVIIAIQNSTVVENMVETLTENGTKEPIHLGISNETFDIILEKLEISTIEKGSDYYNSILAFFGKPIEE